MAVSAIYDNVRMRDERAAAQEIHAAEIESLRKSCPVAVAEPKCVEYFIPTEGRTVVHCHKTITKL
jgi:hypothetical protein